MEEAHKARYWKISIAAMLVLAAGLGIYVYTQYRQQQAIDVASKEVREAVLSFRTLTRENVNFFKANENMRSALEKNAGLLPTREEGYAKIMYADSFSEIDRKKGTEILKEVAIDSKYPNDVRATAINWIINDYELDFIDSDFARDIIFVGPFFGDLISEANGDEGIAIRKLNEWSYNLAPNSVAGFRIAKWYASQLYKNLAMAEAERIEFRGKINEYVAAGDQLLSLHESTIPPQRRGLAYELKARTVWLSGGGADEADRFFKLAMDTYRQPPQSIFQSVYIARTSLYYAAFLSRNYGTKRAEDILALLRPTYKYFSAPLPEPEKRDVRLMSRLIAARDSQQLDYPFVDFNRTDIESFSKVFPEFGQMIRTLDLKEYLRGHPLESAVIGQ